MTKHKTIGTMVEEIADRVCVAFYVTADEIFGATRARRIAEARYVVMAACRKILRMRLLEIGIQLSRDHSTVIHGLREFERLTQCDANYRARIAKHFPELLES